MTNTYAYTATGQRSALTDASGSQSFAYDKRDRLLTNAMPAGTLYYVYDANGNLTNMASTTAAGTSLTYQYDALNRLTNVVDARLSGTQNTSYKYDGVGNLQALQYPSGVTNLYQYDSLNRLTNLNWKLNSTALGSFVYQLGLAGNRTNLSETVNGVSRTYAWKYDSLYRLTNETVTGTAPTGALGYGYDDVGNRTNRTGTLGSLVAQTFTYNTNDWLGTDKYDSNGNTVTNVSSQGYLYDYENRLTNFNNGAVALVYDADGNRLKKTTASTTNLYLVARVNLTGYPQVVEEFTVSGGATNLARAYTYGLALISQRLPAISTNFYGSDGHGSTRFLLNPAGSITDTYMYDAYGTLVNSTGTTANNYLYAGEQYDPDLGFYYLRARYMNPGTGRFWTMDSYEGYNQDPVSLHKYVYSELNPINRTDPSGRDSTDFTQIGQTVHRYIGDDFTGQGIPGIRFSGPSVVNILQSIPGFRLPPNLQGVVTALFPDLTDTIKQEVYEIKPDNFRSIALGEAQLQLYIDLFNYLDPRKGWHRGTTYSPPLTVPVNALTYVIAVGSPITPPGMILYKVFNIRQFAKRKAVQTGAAQTSDAEQTNGIATLDTILAL